MVVNGKVIPCNFETISEGLASTATAAAAISINHTTWIAARAFASTRESWRRAASGSGIRFAHTAPAWVEVPETRLLPRIEQIDWLVQRMQEEIERNTGVLKEAEIAEYHKALEKYENIRKIAQIGR